MIEVNVEAKDADLSALQIDRTKRESGNHRGNSSRKAVIIGVVIVVLLSVAVIVSK